MGWARSPKLLPTERCHSWSIGLTKQTSDNSFSWHPTGQCTIHSGIPILWDQAGMPHLLGIGRGQPCLELLGPPDCLIVVKTADTPPGHCQRSLRSVPYALIPTAHPLMRDVVYSLASTGASATTALGKIKNSFWPVIQAAWSATLSGFSVQQMLADRGWASTEDWNPGASDCHLRGTSQPSEGPHNPHGFGSRTRVPRCPGTPCALWSVNHSNCIGMRTSGSAPSMYGLCSWPWSLPSECLHCHW